MSANNIYLSTMLPNCRFRVCTETSLVSRLHSLELLTASKIRQLYWEPTIIALTVVLLCKQKLIEHPVRVSPAYQTAHCFWLFEDCIKCERTTLARLETTGCWRSSCQQHLLWQHVNIASLWQPHSGCTWAKLLHNLKISVSFKPQVMSGSDCLSYLCKGKCYSVFSYIMNCFYYFWHFFFFFFYEFKLNVLLFYLIVNLIIYVAVLET